MPPLGTSLWNLIDNRVIEIIEAYALTVLELTGLTLGFGEEYDEWKVPNPHLLVRGLEANYTQAEGMFGDGAFHIDNIAYPYEVVLQDRFSTAAAAKDFAKNAANALRNLLGAHPTLDGIRAADGEVTVRVEFRTAGIYIRGPVAEQGKYLGQCVLAFDVISEV